MGRLDQTELLHGPWPTAQGGGGGVPGWRLRDSLRHVRLRLRAGRCGTGHGCDFAYTFPPFGDKHAACCMALWRHETLQVHESQLPQEPRAKSQVSSVQCAARVPCVGTARTRTAVRSVSCLW